MAGELAGKVAVITGGANGIGRGTAEVFVEEGARVVIGDVDVARGAALARELGDAARFMACDVGDKAQIQALVDLAVATFGGLDVMFNNAGVTGTFGTRLIDDEFDDLDRVLRVNLGSVMHGTRIAARAMVAGGRHGAIINTSSIAGLKAGYAIAPYRASKAGINAFTQCAAIELGEHGIRVNAIAPGGIPTQMNSHVMPGLTPNETEGLIAALAPARMITQPLKHVGHPRDIGHMAMFLASDRAAHVTGQVVAVDAGVTAGESVRQEQIFRETQAAYLASIGKG